MSAANDSVLPPAPAHRSTTVIPGARSRAQAEGNAAAADLPPLTSEQQSAVVEIYDRLVRPLVHDRW